MAGDQRLVDRLCRERSDVRPGPRVDEQVQAPGGDVRDARRETEAKQVAQREDMIGDAAPIGMVALDREIRAMVEQAIEDVRCFAGTGRDDPGMEGVTTRK